MPCCEGVIRHKPSGKKIKINVFLMIPCRYPDDTRWVSWVKKKRKRKRLGILRSERPTEVVGSLFF
jgi:hypothetical protein